MATESQIALYENFKAINTIETASYDQFDVKRGLRNADGTGVIAGLTNIANVHGYVVSDGEKVADEGMLRYRGYDPAPAISGTRAAPTQKTEKNEAIQR